VEETSVSDDGPFGGVCESLTTENQKVRADDREERVISLDRYFTDANSLYPTLFIRARNEVEPLAYNNTFS